MALVIVSLIGVGAVWFFMSQVGAYSRRTKSICITALHDPEAGCVTLIKTRSAVDMAKAYGNIERLVQDLSLSTEDLQENSLLDLRHTTLDEISKRTDIAQREVERYFERLKDCRESEEAAELNLKEWGERVAYILSKINEFETEVAKLTLDADRIRQTPVPPLHDLRSDSKAASAHA